MRNQYAIFPDHCMCALKQDTCNKCVEKFAWHVLNRHLICHIQHVPRPAMSHRPLRLAVSAYQWRRINTRPGVSIRFQQHLRAIF